MVSICRTGISSCYTICRRSRMRRRQRQILRDERKSSLCSRKSTTLTTLDRDGHPTVPLKRRVCHIYGYNAGGAEKDTGHDGGHSDVRSPILSIIYFLVTIVVPEIELSCVCLGFELGHQHFIKIYFPSGCGLRSERSVSLEHSSVKNLHPSDEVTHVRARIWNKLYLRRVHSPSVFNCLQLWLHEFSVLQLTYICSWIEEAKKK